MSAAEPTVWDRAATAAAAQRDVFLIGVRAHNGTWFAHCDGHEVDAAGPEQAAAALIKRLASFARKAEREATREAERAQRRAAELEAVNRRPEDRVVDLMAALEQSVAEAKERRNP